MIYLLAFLVCLVLSMWSTWHIRTIAHAKGWTDAPTSERHVHVIPIPRLGGVAIFASFTAVVILATLLPRIFGFPSLLPVRATLGLLGPALIVFALGVYDDLRGVSPAGKFLVQALAATALYFAGYGVHRMDLVSSSQPLQTFIGLPLTIFWVLLITNAFNLIDGLDGLAAGSALFSTAVIFSLSLFAPNPMVSFLAIALAGSILGFLRYNFHPASIFLGDSGSLFIGFLISALAIVSSQKAPTIVAVSIPLVSLGFPILDVVLSVARRFLGGKPLFLGDRDHIHHKLLKRGLSQRQAVLLLYAVTAAFGFISLVLLHQATAVALILALTGIGVLIGLQQLRYNEFGEMLSILQRATRRRQLVANHVAVRNAAESLEKCDQFPAICNVLQGTLQTVGFDGIQLQMLHPNGFPASWFLPMKYEPDGKLLLSWSAGGLDNPPWELRMELLTSSCERWGYFSLFRTSDGKAIVLDMNTLSGEFRAALTRAVERACARMETALKTELDERADNRKVSAAGTGAD
jgi:UDP-GlcNAc:undecaprenyl-phosphate/decaprenyl-phosphate GlcNAc-1-phosphate transferase